MLQMKSRIFIESAVTSRPVQAISLVIGILGGIITLYGNIFPQSVRIAALVCLVLFTSFTFLVLITLVRSFFTSEERAYMHMAKIYGLGYELLQVDCIIENDGSALIKRKMEIIAYSNLELLDTYLSVAEQPPGETIQPNWPDIESESQKYHLSITRSHPEGGKLQMELKIFPPLEEGDRVTFVLSKKLQAGMYAIGLTKEKLEKERTSNTDFFAWNINRPTRKLRLRVSFPQNFSPKSFGKEVHYASASGLPFERRQVKEEMRINKPILQDPDLDRQILELDVKYPMVGLIYLLRWLPIPDTNNLGKIK